LYPIQSHTSSDLTAIRDAARDFATQNILPHVMEWDESQHFPVALFREMGQMGFMGMLVETDLGGSGLGYAE